MTKNLHQVVTDALATLGTVIDDSAGRDAIHLAVEPVVAGERLYPGQHIRLIDGKAYASGDTFGIVDPFLKGPVQEGQRFWFVIYPRQITSLRHVWEHPAFAPMEVKAEQIVDLSPAQFSENWIRVWASTIPLAYDVVMDGARDWLADRRGGGWGEYLNFGGLLEGESVPDDFWPHYEAVTGETVAPEHRGSFFACSC